MRLYNFQAPLNHRANACSCIFKERSHTCLETTKNFTALYICAHLCNAQLSAFIFILKQFLTGDHGFCLFTFFDPSQSRSPLVFRRKKTVFKIFKANVWTNFSIVHTLHKLHFKLHVICFFAKKSQNC
jgi:hypothetical protein